MAALIFSIACCFAELSADGREDCAAEDACKDVAEDTADGVCEDCADGAAETGVCALFAPPPNR